MNIRWYSIIQKSTFSLEPHCSIQMFRSEQICMSWNFTFIIVSLWTRLSSETQSMHKSICLWPLHVGVISHSFQTIDGILSKTLLVFGLEDSRQLVFVCICWHPEEVRKLNVHFSFLSKSFQRRYVISSLPRSERPTHVLGVKNFSSGHPQPHIRSYIYTIFKSLQVGIVNFLRAFGSQCRCFSVWQSLRKIVVDSKQNHNASHM